MIILTNWESSKGLVNKKKKHKNNLLMCARVFFINKWEQKSNEQLTFFLYNHSFS